MEFVKTTVPVLQIDLSASTVSYLPPYIDVLSFCLLSPGYIHTIPCLIKLPKSNNSVKGKKDLWKRKGKGKHAWRD